MKKKDQVLSATGKLCCEACGVDHGERGQGVIECHHTKPLESLEPGATTKLSDLSLVCANCHRIIHAKRPWLSIQDIQTLLRSTPHN